jgi:hypothetical protein
MSKVKFIISRFVYLLVGIFLAISITYVYAAWNDAKTGDSGQLSQSNWNALVNEVHNKCGTSCDAKATAATASSDILTETNWNNLVDLTSTTLTDCTDNNGGKCFINQTSKSALDADLAAGNIKSGVNIFGVAGSYSAPSPPSCTADNSGECYITQTTKSALDTDLVVGNVKKNVTIFGVAGTYEGKNKIRCRGKQGSNYTIWCTLGTDCSDTIKPTYGYNGYLTIETRFSDLKYVKCWNTYNVGADLSCQCESFE